MVSQLKSVLKKCLSHVFTLYDPVITCAHPITGRPIRMRLWAHRGYWYDGTSRDRDEIHSLRKIKAFNRDVIEIGAHIGFLSQVFEQHASGNVLVVEPSATNRILLEQNCQSQTKIAPYACSNHSGTGILYSDGMGGFMNSLDKQFADNREVRSAHGAPKKIQPENVKISTLDQLVDLMHSQPSLIKIDAEGSELAILEGSIRTLTTYRPIVQIEISKDHQQIQNLLSTNGYQLYDKSLAEIIELDDSKADNYIAKHSLNSSAPNIE